MSCCRGRYYSRPSSCDGWGRGSYCALPSYWRATQVRSRMRLEGVFATAASTQRERTSYYHGKTPERKGEVFHKVKKG